MLEVSRENNIQEIEGSESDLYRILSNPVLFREFINLDDKNWEPLEDHERAWTTCTAHFVTMCCGRSVHKTTSMIEMLYYWVVNKMYVPGDQGLFVLVPNKAQKDLSFTRIRSACLTHPFIKHFVNSNSINISEGRIDFINGFQFLIRIAGESGKETNVIGLHTYRIWVDEAQDIPWRTWLSLQNCLKQEIEGYQLITSGVPNGERNENVLYYCDQVDEKYVSFNISQAMMSWWSPEIEYQRRKQYHALQEDSEDFKHYVLGQHGVPTFSVFDRVRMSKEDYEFEKIVITPHQIDSVKRPDMDGNIRYHIEELVLCPPIPAPHGIKPMVGLGYDVGFNPDPAVFFIMYQDPSSGKWKNLLRVVLQRVEYALQREILAWLDTVYQFDFMGIDMGGPGKVQYQDLAGDLTEYKRFKFKERLYPVEFGAYMLVAIDDDGNEKKDNVKRIAVDTLSRWVHEHRFTFASDDDDLMGELERTKFTRTMTGEPVYRTENDHQMAAMMCAILAYENKFGPPISVERDVIVKLLSARWLDQKQNSFYGV